MKLAKSLFLGSVAGLAAVAGAQAADLPVAKAAPVEYVRVCSTYGAGFFYIPGTETCLRVGGRVRAEFGYVEPDDREDDAIGFRARGRIQLDARTATAYGLLRTFVRFEMTRNTGVYGNDPTSPNVDQAFIQFGGLTAGRVVSMFDNSDLPTGHFGTLRFSDAPNVNLFAYTFSFGNGFSATLSAEEGRYGTFVDLPLAEAGQRMPDVVANLKYAGTWGSFQVSGALHQQRSNILTPTNLPLQVPAVFIGTIPDTEYGWAVTAQGSINLPARPLVTPCGSLRPTLTALSATSASARAQASPASAACGRTSTSLMPSSTPMAKSRRAKAGRSPVVCVTTGPRPSVRTCSAPMLTSRTTARCGIDFNEWRAGTNLIWSPVAGLDLGVEVMYSRIDTDVPFLFSGRLDDLDDAWEGRLRVQRDF